MTVPSMPAAPRRGFCELDSCLGAWGSGRAGSRLAAGNTTASADALVPAVSAPTRRLIAEHVQAACAESETTAYVVVEQMVNFLYLRATTPPPAVLGTSALVDAAWAAFTGCEGDYLNFFAQLGVPALDRMTRWQASSAGSGGVYVSVQLLRGRGLPVDLRAWYPADECPISPICGQ